MIRYSAVVLASLLFARAAIAQRSGSSPAGSRATFSKLHAPSLVDKKATKETMALYAGLKKLLDSGVLFGHQDDRAYGVNWKYEKDRSDVKDVTGDYPAVQGYELGHLELDSLVNLDSVPFAGMKSFIRTTYEQGGITTLSWHLRNPLTGKTAWDAAPGTVASILPGGAAHAVYKTWLDKVARFFSDLNGEHGEAIPMIFRPFHELNGNWFWWGKAHCTPQEYKQLYRFTVSYLRDSAGIHQLLYAFNTDKFYTEAEYEERYPGDAWVDVVGFDIYQRDTSAKGAQKFILETDAMLTMLEAFSKKHNKIPALTEFGFNTIPDNTWWTDVLWKAIAPHRISYVLGWRNAGMKKDGAEFYVPYKGHASAPDFIRFYNEPRTLFQNDVANEKIYGHK